MSGGEVLHPLLFKEGTKGCPAFSGNSPAIGGRCLMDAVRATADGRTMACPDVLCMRLPAIKKRDEKFPSIKRGGSTEG